MYEQRLSRRILGSTGKLPIDLVLTSYTVNLHRITWSMFVSLSIRILTDVGVGCRVGWLYFNWCCCFVFLLIFCWVSMLNRVWGWCQMGLCMWGIFLSVFHSATLTNSCSFIHASSLMGWRGWIFGVGVDGVGSDDVGIGESDDDNLNLCWYH